MARAMSEPIALLLDTDMGSDIDDAVCLAYLLRQPRCELVGITTVAGNTLQRAALAGAVCEAAGRDDIPIHAGAAGPLLTGRAIQPVPQYDAIKDKPHRKDFDTDAVDYLRRTIRQRPGEITLLAIGPMTNMALLFAIDPEIPSLLKQLVLMCGVFTAAGQRGPGGREYNAICDPIATAMTYRARPESHISIGLDVTTHCVMPADECRERFAQAGGALTIVADMAEVWFKDRAHITFHDPLAAAAIFEPDLCEYQDGLVAVETVSPDLQGLTAFTTKTDDKPHRIATKVDASRFLEHYFDIVCLPQS